ncbi:ATP-binding protein [Candidatus Marinamargulisbacteria bacterium]|nr:ATP-binding protein [Candidatus Marinamargulisbacteria bacterium]
MKIKKLILKNFRSHEDIEIPLDDSFNAIIGKNDVGKSSVLEALDIFFEGGTIKLDPSDCNVRTTNKKVTIGVVFDIDRTHQILLDSSVKTTLEKESLLNADGCLEIQKVWDCSGKSITARSLSTFIHSYYFSEFKGDPLITKKNSDLKQLLEDKGLECDDQKVNSKLRESIYQSVVDSTKKENVLIQLDEEDAKKTWNSISKDLPMFFLFQSDRANKDSDKEVQDPLKAITKEAISQVEEELQNVKRTIETHIDTLAKETLEKLKEMAPEIANSLTPNISNKAWDSLFSFSFEGDQKIPINKRGSGVRRLILLNYFRAQADKKSADGKPAIYAFEEPETSQHPNHQTLLVNALLELSENDKNQVLITTHSPEIAKMCGDSNLIFLIDENKKTKVQSGDNKLREICNTLGILPYICKFSVFVEGKNDVLFLKTINQNIPELKDLFNFDDTGTQILPLIGGNLENWVNQGYIKDSNIKGFYLFDKDKKEYREKAEEINKLTSKASVTTRLMMENYFPVELIEDKFKVSFEKSEKDNWGEIDIVGKLSEKTDKKEKVIKNILFKELSKKLTKENLENAGTWEEVNSWFSTMKAMYQES